VQGERNEKENAFFIFIAEPQPILSLKIVQGERNEKENALFQILIK